MTKTMIALLFMLLSAACSRQTERIALPDKGEGKQYISALVETIQKSDRIVLTEHSNADDALDELTQPQRPPNYQPIIYASHEFDLQERTNFLAMIKKMADYPEADEPACIFEPHHTMTFYRENKQLSAMRICFECSQVEWDGTTTMRPSSLVPVLRTLATTMGMKDERDWRALAKKPVK